MMRSRKKSAHVKMPVVWERLFLTNTAVPILTQKNVCPAECIKMERDSEGFYYPFVNQEKCIVCGRCEKYCYNTVTNPQKEIHVYAAYNKDLIRRLKASSGGIFELLSREVLSRQGVVFGVKMDGLKAIHTYVETLEDLDRLLGSKYIQSDVGKSYQHVKEFLRQGRWVLFSGTPCQVDALLKFPWRETGVFIDCGFYLSWYQFA